MHGDLQLLLCSTDTFTFTTQTTSVLHPPSHTHTHTNKHTYARTCCLDDQDCSDPCNLRNLQTCDGRLQKQTHQHIHVRQRKLHQMIIHVKDDIVCMYRKRDRERRREKPRKTERGRQTERKPERERGELQVRVVKYRFLRPTHICN